MIATLNISETHSVTTYNLKLSNKKPSVWITAGNSFIAKNIVEQLNYEYDFIVTTRSEVDLTNYWEMDRFLHDEYFDYVIHTACVGGRKDNEPQRIFDDNYNMFENLLNNQNHFKYLINFGSGADKLDTWYGKSKRVIRGIIREKPNMFNIRLYGVWGKYEKPDRFPSTVLRQKEITIEDKLMRYIHVDELVKIVDSTMKEWPKIKREITVGEPILLSEFAKQLNPKIKIHIKGKGKDYV